MIRYASFASSCFLIAACSGPSPTDSAAISSSALDTRSDHPVSAASQSHDIDRVFVLGNEARNEVIVFNAPDDGALREIERVATGGRGSDDGLGSQGALALTGDGRWLLAVDAGSSEISLFRVARGHLELVDVASSGGDRPISVAESRGLVYVLNAGATQNVSGFEIDAHRGELRRIDGSARALSREAAVGAAEVAFSPDGDALVVSEKATNTIDSFVVRRDGTLSDARTLRSVGDTPFGFAFDSAGTLIVSDAFGGAAGAGALSSYRLDRGAAATVVSGPVADHQGAPCWVIVTRDGRFAYTSNTASGTISGYTVAANGGLSLFGDGGATARTGDGTKPIDMTLDDEGRLLYVLESGTSAIEAFRIGNDGSLSPAGNARGLPAHAVGVAATTR